MLVRSTATSFHPGRSGWFKLLVLVLVPVPVSVLMSMLVSMPVLILMPRSVPVAMRSNARIRSSENEYTHTCVWFSRPHRDRAIARVSGDRSLGEPAGPSDGRRRLCVAAGGIVRICRAAEVRRGLPSWRCSFKGDG